uniref:Uncharacterized protein n=1 Tax=Rhizophora mucronata TaxID=61149 RepID=A0A2P2IS28_RHIMU
MDCWTHILFITILFCPWLFKMISLCRGSLWEPSRLNENTRQLLHHKLHFMMVPEGSASVGLCLMCLMPISGLWTIKSDSLCLV